MKYSTLRKSNAQYITLILYCRLHYTKYGTVQYATLSTVLYT